MTKQPQPNHQIGASFSFFYHLTLVRTPTFAAPALHLLNLLTPRSTRRLSLCRSASCRILKTQTIRHLAHCSHIIPFNCHLAEHLKLHHGVPLQHIQHFLIGVLPPTCRTSLQHASGYTHPGAYTLIRSYGILGVPPRIKFDNLPGDLLWATNNYGVSPHSRLSTLLHRRLVEALCPSLASRPTLLATRRRLSEFYSTVKELIIFFTPTSTPIPGHTLLSPRSGTIFS